MFRPGDPACQYVQERPRSRIINSEENFKLARGWMETCLESHEGCEKSIQSPSQFSPTRLLEIVNESTVRLQSSNEISSSRWTALSYCWGGPQPVQTTRNTLERLSSNFCVSDLPKTIQDALTTTRKIGLRFLWVDCLCIIQDDPEEMTREIANMPQIYKNAQVTISAAPSRGSREGFLHEVQIPSPQDDAFRFKFRCPDGQLGSVIIYGQDNLEHRRDPIENRAWTLQEHLLSPRLLIFGSRQIWWTCRNVHSNFNSGRGIFCEYSEIGEIRLRFLNIRISQRRRAMKHIPGNTWLSLVQHYTSCQMSFSQDKLPAISGIAEYYGKKMKDEYIAGLFRKILLPSLLWKRESPILLRPVYRAPSWSWAAVDGTVRWELYRGITSEHLELLDCRVELESEDAPYGAIKHAELTLRGRLKQVLWSNAGDYLLEVTSAGGIQHRYLAETILDAVLEPMVEESGMSPVWCLEICAWDPDDTKWRTTLAGAEEIIHGRREMFVKPGVPKGLILTSDDAKTFRRVGFFSFRDQENFPIERSERENPAFIERVRKEKESFFEGCKPRDITIL